MPAVSASRNVPVKIQGKKIKNLDTTRQRMTLLWSLTGISTVLQSNKLLTTYNLKFNYYNYSVQFITVCCRWGKALPASFLPLFVKTLMTLQTWQRLHSNTRCLDKGGVMRHCSTVEQVSIYSTIFANANVTQTRTEGLKDGHFISKLKIHADRRPKAVVLLKFF